MELGNVFLLWQYYAGALLVGSLLGKLIFRIIPLPADVAEHLDMIKRAGLLSEIAKGAGSDSMDMVAKRVGAHELVAIVISVRNQRRQMLVIGIVLALIVLLLAFMYLPFMLIIPAWIYILGALVGAYLAWQSW